MNLHKIEGSMFACLTRKSTLQVLLLLCAAFVGALLVAKVDEKFIQAQAPNPSNRFDPKLSKAAKAECRPEMRQFAWSCFNDPPKKGNRGTIVFWESWPKKEDLLKHGSDFLHERSWAISDLGPAVQLQHLAKAEPNDHSEFAPLSDCIASDAVPDCHESSITVFQMPDRTARYSRSLKDYIRVDVRGNSILAKHLSKINATAGFDDRVKEEEFPQIPPFPRSAATVKAVWWPLKKNRNLDSNSGGEQWRFGPYSCVPIWDGKTALPFECGIGGITGKKAGNDFSRWERLVAVDTESKITNATKTRVSYPDWSRTEDVTLSKTLSVVPIGRFHHKILAPEDLANSVTKSDLDALFTNVWHEPVEPGDALILVAVHLAVKELEDWVWITCWWHPDANEGPFAGHPKMLPELWKNYLMDVSYREDTPGDCAEAVRPIFNPWLEGFFKFGVASNCISCHQRAVWVSRNRVPGKTPTSGVTHGLLDDSDPCFKNRVRLDYVWFLTAAGR